MKKPVWLRAVGWIDLGLWLFCALAVFAVFVNPVALFGAIWILYIFAPVAFALFCLWAIVSGIVWSATKNARIQAAVTRDVVERVVLERTPPVEFPIARTGIVCGKCGNYAAVLHCHRHSESLCWRCAVKTDTGTCTYIIANRLAKPMTEGKPQYPRVRTSPLNLS